MRSIQWSIYYRSRLVFQRIRIYPYQYINYFPFYFPWSLYGSMSFQIQPSKLVRYETTLLDFHHLLIVKARLRILFLAKLLTASI